MINSLSIITVNLNNAEGLRKTIESVLVQSFINFEYIIIDGGSTDSSIDVIQYYSNSIHYWVSEKDNGIYHAMNKGILSAKGEYLLFLNSGDYLYTTNTLSDVFSIYHTEDFLCGSSVISKDDKVIHVTNPPEVHTFLAYYRATISHQATFIKRYLFNLYGLYREDFRYNSDWEFWIRTIILQNCSTRKLSVVICNYDLNGVSSINSESEEYKREVQEVLSIPLLQKFVPDYESQWQKKREMAPLYWVKSKKVLFKLISFLYKLAGYYNKVKNKIYY